ncbi:MAG: hypothetical protein GY938_16750 [Ketobacter sp.]|nr:hypothetical protein [Ketobacter sp.]
MKQETAAPILDTIKLDPQPPNDAYYYRWTHPVDAINSTAQFSDNDGYDVFSFIAPQNVKDSYLEIVEGVWYLRVLEY